MPTTAQQLLWRCTSGDVRLHNSRCACVFQLLYDKKRSSSQCRENDLLSFLCTLSFPQSVEIAVFASRNILGFCVGQEDSFRLFAWLQLVTKHIGRGEQFYPLDVMLWKHRMLHTSYCYAIAALNRFYHRHVLLFGAITGVFLHQLHRLATATKHGSWVYNFYYIATNLAAVDFSNLLS